MSQLTAEYRHIPVLLPEVLEALALTPNAIVCDCTLGGGGHAAAIAEKLGNGGGLIGIDQDEAALAAAKSLFESKKIPTPYMFAHGNFREISSVLLKAQVPYVNACLFDLGVSSPQLDVHERGFTYQADAPLDMRMDSGKHIKTAAEVLNTYNEADLARIFFAYGDEPHARKIAHSIVANREKHPYATTFDLVKTIKNAYTGREKRAKHPARRVFQALRIEVNQEVEALEVGLEAAIRWLAPHGRIAVITYHSLEDRIVKHAFAKAERGCSCPPDLPVCACNNVPVLKSVTKKGIVASAEEVEHNPRARSARLRVAEKLGEQ